MATNSVTSLGTASGSGSTTASVNLTPPGGNLDKNAFLQLLATQMQYQDPLQPQSNTQFIAQLAQFSSLEQMSNVATNDGQISTQMSALQNTADWTFANGLLGKEISVQPSSGSSLSGLVQAVQSQNGQVVVQVGGQFYPLSDVVAVTSTTANAATSGGAGQ